MNSVKRRVITRLAAAVLTTGLAAAGAIATAGPALADDTPQNVGGVTATLGDITAGSGAYVKDPRKTGPLKAGLFEMKVDGGGTLQTYCIDILTNTVDGAKYKEVGWSESSLENNKNAGKIRWILQNSYPQVNDLAALGAKSGAGTLDANLAAAGTQVAIWRYSDGVKVDARDPAAEKLADYLFKNAQDLAEPKASLSLTPPAVSGKSGQKLGPLTVRTNADSVTVTPSGDAAAKNVKVVDKAGKPVTSTVNGGQLFFDVPASAADGSTSLKATATTKVPVGRAFIGDNIRTQTQILAGSSESTVSAVATANWAKKGAVPAVSAKKDCAKGGVEITVANKGDEAFGYEINGKKHTAGPGRTETTLVKVGEDQAYKITVTGPNGFAKTFSGVLDCKTGDTAGGNTGGGSSATPSPSGHPGNGSTGGSGGSSGSTGATKGGDLASTGSSSATPVIAGTAAALVVVGGTAVFLLRRKKTAGGK